MFFLFVVIPIVSSAISSISIGFPVEYCASPIFCGMLCVFVWFCGVCFSCTLKVAVVFVCRYLSSPVYVTSTLYVPFVRFSIVNVACPLLSGDV